MKQRIFPILMAVCLCLSLAPAAYAEESGSSVVPDAGFDWSTRENYPAQSEITAKMLSLQSSDRYKDGVPWDDNNHSYRWNGGPLPPGNVYTGTGCAAFAFELSDFVFGSLQARTYPSFTISDVRVGDILYGTSHNVIVTHVSDTSVKIAEGNVHINDAPGVVQWGRTLTRDEVESFVLLVTRYPADYALGDDADEPIEDENGLAQGTLEGGISWKVTKGGTLSITGSGAMPETIDYISDLPWVAYADRIAKIEIGSGVTSISINAFRGSGALSAVIPSSVKAIGDSAFRECGSLTTVTISGSGLETIGENVFRSCGSLASITLPASVVSVGAGTFYQCTKLAKVIFTPGDKAVAMGSSLFARCWALSAVQLPKKINSSIGEDMFTSCLVLSSLTIPEGAVSIDARAFASSGLRQLTIPASVTEFKTASFSSCNYLTDIYFAGSEEAWNSISKTADVTQALSKVTIHYNSTMPGDGTSGGDDGGTDHEHSWASDWSSDSGYHWHECQADGCGVTDGCEAHSYGDWEVDKSATSSQSGSRHRTCTVCGYVQTETIPATGGSSSSGSGSSSSGGSSSGGSGSSSSSSSNTTTSTTRNPDGSTTTTRTNKSTGTVTETTISPDGSRTVVETQKNGTVTTQETDRAGNKTETVSNPNGSGTVTVERKDGTTAAVTISAAGKTEAEVNLSASAVSAARQNSEAVPLPIPEVRASRDTESAPVITVNTGSAEPVKAEIPVAAPTPGTVAVLVREDGTEEVIKTSLPTAEGVEASLPDGATVKIMDNSKDFADISSQYWAADAIDFVSARELFAGTTETTFTPESSMTRAMLMVVLARLDGADTSGGETWYEKGMAWAVANSVSDGSSPNSGITREQLVTMLWRYAGSPAAAETELHFTDVDNANGYALEALRWAVENGIINGYSSGQLKPKGSATRAQVAQILMNFLQKS